ncbi:MAG: hypothetical protein V4481_03455 [Patescibacteria group bacterium]
MYVKTATERIPTTLQPGDVITVTPTWQVSILRNGSPLEILPDILSLYFGPLLGDKEASVSTRQEYAHNLALMVASVAGFPVEQVSDDCVLTSEGYHKFPLLPAPRPA